MTTHAETSALSAAVELREVLDAFDITQCRIARLFGVAPRSIRRWRRGDRHIPHGICILLRLLDMGAITVAQVEEAAASIPARTNGSSKPEPPAPRPVEPAPETPADPGPAIATTAAKVYRLAAGTCRWPCGDPRRPDFYFCARPAVKGSYCEKHGTMAHMHDTMERQASRRPEQPVRMVGIASRGELHRAFSAAASL